ncbi:MAG: glycosyltransferase [Chloroflexi bacterium]|nr:glycosyltransferase [Chloroflexota bacterium]
MRQALSLVATVLNEAQSIERLLASVLRQTRPPDELVVVDGGSNDGTLEALERFAASARLPTRVLSQPGANISQGRNLAIAAAQGPIIAVMDAGVRLEETWLEHLVAPFEAARPPDVVSGFFVADPQSPFERALGAVTLPSVEEIDPERFNPSSRSVAYRKEAWRAVRGYPEWLDYCEDLVFDFALRDAGCTFVFAPEALVRFRPRSSLRLFARQYYRYARGDGKADLWLYRHLIRYGAYLGGALLLVLAIAHHPLWLLALAAGLAAMLRKPLRRLRPSLGALSPRERVVVLAWLPIIRLTGDLAKMAGYPVGVWWRWRHAPREPWPKRVF